MTLTSLLSHGLTAVLVASIGASCASTPPVAAPDDVAIVNANVVDVERGQVVRDRTILLSRGRIADVRASAPRGARVIDARGAYVIPGLWDMHAHVLNHWEERAGVFVANGVTGVRELGNASLDSLRAVRARLRASTAPEPRLVSAAVLIDGSPPVSARAVVLDRAEDAPRIVDSLVAGGVDFLKAYARLKREPFFALAAEARRRNLALAGHVPTALTPEEISDAGIRSIEHIFEFPLACSSRTVDLRAQRSALEGNPALRTVRIALGDTAFRTYDRGRCLRIHEHLARNGTFVTPTLYLWKRGGPARAQDHRDSVVGRYFREKLPSVIEPAVPEYRFSEERTREFYQLLAAIVADMHRAGVPLLVGSDTHGPLMWPGFSVHYEMQTLVDDVHLTPAEVLRAATVNAARYFAATDSMGTVAAGKVADLVFLTANPLDDIRNTEKISGVVLRGRYLSRAALDELLAMAERKAAGRSPPLR